MFPAIDRLRTLLVSDVMAKRVVEVSAHDTMDEAARQFRACEISSAPVVDEQGRCVGMLSAADYLRRDCSLEEGTAGGTLTAHELVREPGGEPLEIAAPGDAVGRYMSQGVQSVAAHDSLLHAARIMSTAHLHHLPVLERGRVIGVISTLDVVAALVNAVEEAEAHGR